MNAANDIKQTEPQEKPMINVQEVHKQKQSNLLATSLSPSNTKGETGGPAAKGPSNVLLSQPLSIKKTAPSEGENGINMQGESLSTFYSTPIDILRDQYQSVKSIASTNATQPSANPLKTPIAVGVAVDNAKRKIDESLLTSTDATVSSSKEIVNSNKTSSMLSVNGSIKSSKGDLAAGVSRASGKAVSSSVVKQAKVNDESPRKRKRAKTSAVYHTKRKKRKASVESREMMISDSSTSATLSTRSKYTGDVNCNNKKPGLSTKARASSPQAENDNTDGAAIAAKPSFTDSDIKKLVNEVATVVANEIRNGSCWRFDGPIPQCIVVQSKVSRICVVKPAKILKSGSKLIDTRQSSDFGTGSSGNQNGSKQASQKKEACAAVAKENDGASEPLKSWIALAVERFVADVYFPHLIAAKSRMRSMPPTSERIIISILLAIREMMTMNADRLFSSVHQVNVHAYAGAIVHVCAKKMSSIMSTFSVENFLSAIQGYDSRREDFRYSAVETDARAVCILPDGTKQSKEENIVARTSCNFTRSKHPLSFNKKILTKEDASNSLHKSYSSAAPCPNALAAMLMKPQDIKSDISKIDRACSSVTDQEKYLHFMSRTRSKKRQAYNKCIDRK